MRTITGTLNVYSYEGSDKPSQLIKMSDDGALKNVSFAHGDWLSPWVKIGKAEVTVTLDDDDDVVDSIVDTLKAQKKRVQADAQVEINRLDERIQSLLALPAPVQS